VTPADGRNFDKVVKLIGKTPEEIKLDVDWSEASAGGGRRDTRRRPERRDRSYGRPASETSVAAMEPAKPTPRAAAAEAPPAAEASDEPRRSARPRREPRDHREERPRKEARAETQREPQREASRETHREPPRQEREPRHEARRAAPRSRGDDDRRGRGDDDRRVVGFGNDVPAFLARK